MHRRAFLATAAATGLLAACGGKKPPGPAMVTLNVTAAPGMNPGPDGSDRPVTLSLLRLKDAGAFNSADMFALLEDPATVLAADLIGMDQLPIAPGGKASKTITFEPAATQLGLLAALRDPAGKVWRTAVPVAPGMVATGSVTLGPKGIELKMA
ncbi:MAG: type VI secretion system lipoprotein TssJ [Amaricoccus sp.]